MTTGTSHWTDRIPAGTTGESKRVTVYPVTVRASSDDKTGK